MSRQPTQMQSAMGTLNADNIHGGAIIGDTCVTTAMVRVDPTGSIYPIRCKSVNIPTSLINKPSVKQIKDALQGCWRELYGPSIAYNQFFLCLPPWCTEVVEAKGRIPIDQDPHVIDLRPAEITAGHVRQLEDLVCEKGSFQGLAAIRMIPHYYVLDDGRRVSDPTGNISRTLGLKASLVLADLGALRGILDCLWSMGIRVDALMSPQGAAAQFLSPEDMEEGVALIDVSQRTTALSFFEGGTLVHAALVPCGSDDVINGAAGALGIPARELSAFLTERRDILSSVSPDEDVLLFPSSGLDTIPLTLTELDQVAQAPAAKLLAPIAGCLNSAREDGRANAKKVILIGDEYLTLRTLKKSAGGHIPVPCMWILPTNVYGGDSAGVWGYARMVGTMRHGALTQPGRQPYLERYNESPINYLNRVVWSGARYACRSLVSSFSSIPRRYRQT